MLDIKPANPSLKDINCRRVMILTDSAPLHQNLFTAITNRSARVGVIGLGYVGLPLAMTIANGGFSVIGFDIDPGKIVMIDDGKSYIESVSNTLLGRHVGEGRFRATTDFASLGDCDIIIICVPTPLTKQRDLTCHSSSKPVTRLPERCNPGS